MPLLITAPGLGWVLADTVAAELGEIERLSSPRKLVRDSGLCPRVYQSGGKDHRGSRSKNGPEYLRWVLIEAATDAGRHAAYRDRYQRTAARLGRQRNKKVARVEVARKLADAIWHLSTKGEPFAPHIEPANAKKMAARVFTFARTGRPRVCALVLRGSSTEMA
ncbi:MAG TPA: transposase [Acidimicrobiales bacterium]|nr:transposase [Acidimicrobiales bacterium]